MEIIKILSTRDLPQQAFDFALKNEISLKVLNFIETFPVINVEVQQEIEAALQIPAVVIFTSINAVQYVASLAADENPEWIIYCIGTKTLSLVKKYFPHCKVDGTAQYAAALADKIIADNLSNSVYFFCGNKRRNELPDALTEAGIEVNEIEVYETVELHHNLQDNYDAVLFFSPSAVNSFFATNKLNGDCVLFAIGETTASAIGKHFEGTIITGDASGKVNLLTEAINYFTIN